MTLKVTDNQYSRLSLLLIITYILFYRYLFALQIKRDMLTGSLACQQHTAILLASYIVQGKVLCLIFWLFLLSVIIIIDSRGLNARWCLTPLLLSLPTAA